jgi:hypothetical protein
MTTPKAIHAVGASLVSYLNKAFEISGPALTGVPTCKVRLLSSGDFTKIDDILDLPSLTLYLYRISVNEHARNVRRPVGATNQTVPMAVDLHFLLTAWADSAEEEHTTLAWAMRELYMHPVLDASSLNQEAAWDPADVIQIAPSELNLEDMTRVWDALEPSYRLSVSYCARVVRIDPDRSPDRQVVVATRLGYADRAEPDGS